MPSRGGAQRRCILIRGSAAPHRASWRRDAAEVGLQRLRPDREAIPGCGHRSLLVVATSWPCAGSPRGWNAAGAIASIMIRLASRTLASVSQSQRSDPRQKCLDHRGGSVPLGVVDYPPKNTCATRVKLRLAARV